MATVLHLQGEILVGPEEVRAEAWVVGGRLTYERPTAAGDDVQTLRGWVLPGLVDAHCHVGLDAHGAVDDETSEAQALADREAGTLLIRDAGSPADTRWIDERDDLPKVIRAGRHIARTRRYIRNYAHEIEPDQLVERVRLEAKSGDGWVKLVGDWIDRDTGDLSTCWPVDVLTDAIAAAHEEGARVTAHTFGTDALPDLVRAGIDCIEHGTGLTEDLIAEMAERGTAVVPTLVNVENFPGFAAAGEKKFPAYASTIRRLYATSCAVVRAAFDAGVPVFAGTDAGGGIAHGVIADEVRALHRAGLPAEAALAAASWSARAWLGLPCIEEGAPADVVVYDSDPRAELDVLARPARMILRGRVVA
jgi:imidazolonepropionase-like amidohydrolase